MRRCFVAVGLVLAGLVLGVLLVARVPARAGGAVPLGATENGDTNGDGVLDLSDAVYLLLHLFRGGPPPVACADSLELVGRVAALESKVATLEHDAICSPERRSPERFVDQADGTVLDPCTGLYWTKSIVDFDGDGELTFSDEASWDNALAYCASLRLGGKSDWRLPSVDELAGLVRCSACEPRDEWPQYSPFRFPHDLRYPPEIRRFAPPWCWTRDSYPIAPDEEVYQFNLGARGDSRVTCEAPKATTGSMFLAVRGP